MCKARLAAAGDAWRAVVCIAAWERDDSFIAFIL